MENSGAVDFVMMKSCMRMKWIPKKITSLNVIKLWMLSAYVVVRNKQSLRLAKNVMLIFLAIIVKFVHFMMMILKKSKFSIAKNVESAELVEEIKLFIVIFVIAVWLYHNLIITNANLIAWKWIVQFAYKVYKTLQNRHISWNADITCIILAM